MSRIGYWRDQEKKQQRKEKRMSEFVSAAPPSGGLTWADHVGALFIIEPLGVETGLETVHGVTDVVRAHVHVVTGDGEGEEYKDTLIFPKALQSQTRGQIGKKVVGRLGQGVAQPGKNAPWVIQEATDEDIEKAKAYLAGTNLTTAAPAATAEPPF